MNGMVPGEWERRVRADLEASAPLAKIIIFPGVLAPSDRDRLEADVQASGGWHSLMTGVEAPVRAQIPDPVTGLISGLCWSPCRDCGGLRWVCEVHRGRPWGGLCCDGPRRARVLHRVHGLLPYLGLFRLAWRIPVSCGDGACHCGGAGDPCGACNPGGTSDPGWVAVR